MSFGTSTLQRTKNIVEVTNISPFGLWILLNENEYFISNDDYPAFQSATIRQIANVEVDFSKNLHWQDLDVDIEYESLENPEKYPLIFK